MTGNAVLLVLVGPEAPPVTSRILPFKDWSIACILGNGRRPESVKNNYRAL
jgi:hypothetical protein